MVASTKEHIYRTFLGGGCGLLFVLALLKSQTLLFGMVLASIASLLFVIAFHEMLTFLAFPKTNFTLFSKTVFFLLPILYSFQLIEAHKAHFLSPLLLLFTLSFVSETLSKYPRYSVQTIASLVLSLIYLYIPLFLALDIIFFHSYEIEGNFFFLELLLITKAVDIGAFYIGKSLGRSLMAPKLSPKKTWEGFWGGLAFAQIVYNLFYFFLPQHEYFSKFFDSAITGIFLVLLVSVLSVISDLFESMLKRLAKVKDSGSIPGVGGALDAIDSLLFVIPFAYVILHITG